MIWMVHRAWLNDPTLLDLNFDNMHMPPPHIEKRIAPKLMKAMETNTWLRILSLSNSNMQRGQGFELADALRRNPACGLRVLNLETNCLDSSAVCELANAIGSNQDLPLEQLRVQHQKQVGQFFGRPTEEAMGKMMASSQTIIKLSFECDDAHWRNMISRALLRNNDSKRRQNALVEPEADAPVDELTLGNVALQHPPPPEAGTVVEGTPNMIWIKYVIQNKMFPTTSQLQSHTKNSGVVLTYSAALPLIRECRSRMLNVALNSEVVVTDAFGKKFNGCLVRWTDLHENWHVDVLAPNGKRCVFKSRKEPAFSVSEAWVEWLRAIAGET